MRVPSATSIVGASQALVSLFFYEQDNGTIVGDGGERAPGCLAHKYGGQGPWDSFCSEGASTDDCVLLLAAAAAATERSLSIAGYIWSSEIKPWSVRDITIYVTKFHLSVVHV